jgi:hypothetical protein
LESGRENRFIRQSHYLKVSYYIMYEYLTCQEMVSVKVWDLIVSQPVAI